LLGRAKGPLRQAVVHHSINGSFAIRQGDWKLELCPDSGGWSEPRPGTAEAKRRPPVQLYDMSQDAGERTNVQERHADTVAHLTKLLEKYVADGRSTAGDVLTNDVPIEIWKSKPPRRDAAGKVIIHD
jgi:arylsulfatase A